MKCDHCGVNDKIEKEVTILETDVGYFCMECAKKLLEDMDKVIDAYRDLTTAYRIRGRPNTKSLITIREFQQARN